MGVVVVMAPVPLLSVWCLVKVLSIKFVALVIVVLTSNDLGWLSDFDCGCMVRLVGLLTIRILSLVTFPVNCRLHLLVPLVVYLGARTWGLLVVGWCPLITPRTSV